MHKMAGQSQKGVQCEPSEISDVKVKYIDRGEYWRDFVNGTKDL